MKIKQLTTRQISYVSIGLLIILVQNLYRYHDNSLVKLAFYAFMVSILFSIISILNTLRNKIKPASYFLIASLFTGILSIILKVL